jgi:hypothetical protein
VTAPASGPEAGPVFADVLTDEELSVVARSGAVVKLLRAQAEHVAAGGTVRESPVARAHLARG